MSRITILGAPVLFFWCKWTAARFDFGIQPGKGTCGHDASQQFGKRLLLHVEEHGANGWRDCVQTGNLDSPHRVFEFCIPVEVSVNARIS